MKIGVVASAAVACLVVVWVVWHRYYSRTQLFSAVATGNISRTKLLLTLRANHKEEDNSKVGLILLAVGTGKAELVATLIEHGVPLTPRVPASDPKWHRSGPTEGMTALHLAVFCRNVKIAEMLLDAGMDVNIRAKNGNTPTDIAEVLNLPRGNPMIRLLLDRGGLPNFYLDEKMAESERRIRIEAYLASHNQNPNRVPEPPASPQEAGSAIKELRQKAIEARKAGNESVALEYEAMIFKLKASLPMSAPEQDL